MKTEDLQAIITDTVTFLQDLDKLLPNKVDEELIKFLNHVQGNTWLLDLLSGSLGGIKLLEAKRR